MCYYTARADELTEDGIDEVAEIIRDKYVVHNKALEAVAKAAVGVKHHRSGRAGYVEIGVKTWEAIVAALDVLAAAKEGD